MDRQILEGDKRVRAKACELMTFHTGKTHLRLCCYLAPAIAYQPCQRTPLLGALWSGGRWGWLYDSLASEKV